MRVTLINPPALPGRFNYSAFTHPPLGLACLAAVLRERGHSVTVIDAVGEAIARFTPYSPSKQFLVQGLSISQIIDRVHPDSGLIGVSCMFSHTWPLVRLLIRRLCEAFPRVPIIAGGEHPTALFDLCLKQAPLAACILGEGEQTVVEITEALEAGRPLREIAGLPLKDPETKTVRLTSPRRPITDPDSLPRPAWDLIPWTAYRFFDGPVQSRPMAVLASRGCPHRCAFCSAPAMWTGGWRKRTPENIVREMTDYQRDYHTREFLFRDISSFISRSWTRELCLAIHEQLPGIRWQMPVGARPEIMDEETAALLVASGCSYFQFAPESGSPAVLAAMNKRLDLNRFRRAVLNAKKAGMIVGVLFIIGYPTETLRDVRLTFRLIRWLARHDIDEIAVSSFVLLPGTRTFSELAAKRLLVIDDAFCYQTAGATAFTPTASWNPMMGKKRLLLLKWLGLIQFYAIAFFRRPSRLLRMIRNVYRGRQETKSERVLTEILEKCRQGFRKNQGGF